MPPKLKVPRLPLPFGYEATGVETRLTSGLDFLERSRNVFAFHHPEMLVERLAQAPVSGENSTFRSRVHHPPPLTPVGSCECRYEAIINLKRSLAAYRPLKFGGVRRILT